MVFLLNMQRRSRIIRNDHEDCWIGRIHEYIDIADKNVVLSDICITHKKTGIAEPTRNLEIFQKMEEDGVLLSMRDLTLYAREAVNAGLYDKTKALLSMLFNRKIEYRAEKKYFDMAMETKLILYEKTGKGAPTVIDALMDYFKYAAPTPLLCCKLAKAFSDNENYEASKTWYLAALGIAQESPDESTDYNAFLPAFGLAYCYCRSGNKEKAVFYGKEALKVHPDDSSALDNLKIYEAM